MIVNGQDSQGKQFWDQLFSRQYPKCDISIENCEQKLIKWRRILNSIMKDRNEHALEIANVAFMPQTLVHLQLLLSKLLIINPNYLIALCQMQGSNLQR